MCVLFVWFLFVAESNFRGWWQTITPDPWDWDDDSDFDDDYHAEGFI